MTQNLPITPSVTDATPGYFDGVVTYFEDKWEVVRGIEVNPFEALIGFNFLAIGVVNLIRLFGIWDSSNPELRRTLQREKGWFEKTFESIVSIGNVFGSVARFVDWGAEKAWFVLSKVQAVFVKCLGHITGVMLYFYNCFTTIEKMHEVEKRVQEYQVAFRADRNVLSTYKTVQWFTIFSHLLMGVHSAFSVISLMGTALMTTATANMILTAGLACYIAGRILEWGADYTPLKNLLDSFGDRQSLLY